MTARERAEQVVNSEDTPGACKRGRLIYAIEEAINAAVEEAEDRLLNERDSHLERIDELEANNEALVKELAEANKMLMAIHTGQPQR